MVRLSKYSKFKTKENAKRVAKHLGSTGGKQYINIRVRKVKNGYGIYGKRK